MTRIGGRLDMTALATLMGDRADDRADAPLDRAKARVAALELRSSGLTACDIADALGLSEGAVRSLLGEPQA